jgi:dihydroorotate dehydrogenase electron transfer subunit
VKTGYAEVVENECLYGDTWAMWLRAPELARGAYPGQFVMLRCSDDGEYATGPGRWFPADDRRAPSGVGQPSPAVGSNATPPAADYDPLLPRPMSYHRVRVGTEGPEWAILYDVVGRGTAWLAHRGPGDRIYGWGPLGVGYKIGRGSKNLLLVGGGIGIAPLVWLADEAIAQGRNVTIVIGARDAGHVFPASLLPHEAEVIVATDDGSAGRKGFATEPFAELLDWCDQAFACGPTPMFRAMADVARRSKARRSVQVLLEERMGCGTGICYGCAVQIRVRGGRAMKLVCKDGPRFEVRDVY